MVFLVKKMDHASTEQSINQKGGVLHHTNVSPNFMIIII